MQPLEIAGGAKKADGRRGIGSAPLARLLRQARKPSSVPRAEARGMVICLGRLSPTASSSLPAARRISRPGGRCGSHLAAYLALLRLGVTVPPLLPAMRWALTPPFHPCRSPRLAPWFQAVSSLWPCPSPLGAQALPGSLPVGARTFLEPRPQQAAAWTRDHPSCLCGMNLLLSPHLRLP